MRRAIQGSLAATVLAVAVAAAGCNRSQPQPSTNTAAQSPATEPTTPADRLGDSALATAVQAKFYTDDRIRGHDIDVSAESGTIVLRGSVPNDAMKTHAVSLARSVDRVTNVNDQIQVQEPPVRAADAPGQQDGRATGTTGRAADALQPWWITTKIQAQYFADADVKPWNVDVTTVSNGVVTLEGTVESTEAKNEAVRIARETEGVTRVEDRLRVEANARRAGGGPNAPEPAGTAPPDAWLTAKVQAKYFIDDEVKGRNIDVQTQNGVVTLTGSVASEAERRQAVAIARNTDGVRDVSDKLRVNAVDTTMTRPAGAPDGQPPASGQAGATAAGASSPVEDRRRTATGPKPGVRIERPDAWITMKIQAKYFLDAEVKGHVIDVDTSNGIVTLTGRVENAEQKADAEQIARETEGVARVKNQLIVGLFPAS